VSSRKLPTAAINNSVTIVTSTFEDDGVAVGVGRHVIAICRFRREAHHMAAKKSIASVKACNKQV
jgi:hypothetical protein